MIPHKIAATVKVEPIASREYPGTANRFGDGQTMHRRFK